MDSTGSLQRVFEALPQAVLVFDAALQLVHANAAARRLLGPAGSEAPWPLRLSDGTPCTLADLPLDRVLATGQPLPQTTLTVEAPDGQTRFFKADAAPLADDSCGRPTGVVLTLADVSRQHAAPAGAGTGCESLQWPPNKATARRFASFVADHVPARIAYWDRALVCRFVNRAFCEYLGQDAGSILGRTSVELFGPQHVQRMAPRVCAVLAGKSQTFEREDVDAAGHARTTLLHYRPDWRDGGVQGFFVLATDVSELAQARQQLRRLNEELARRAEQAEAATRAKSAFLATMSHELRTPLNAVIGLSQLQQQMALPPRAQEYAGHIGRAGAQLLSLINEVLDLARIESGELRLEHLPFELGNVLEEVHSIVHPLALAKGLVLQFDAEPAKALQLRGDALRLKQILLNLLGNAVKFTPCGSVALRVHESRRSAAGVTLCLQVQDTGIGIASDVQPRIFDAFTQADSSITRRFGGTGLGLSIVRRLVDMMGGTLQLQSALGEGSTFRVVLTLAQAP